jgi:hypothetical protein
MPKSKRKKTLADYIVIAISPVLIMTLVGSLTFFLLQLTYHGQYEMRLKWILFWFILAAVLVARIAIEQGTEHATMFGIALTAAVGLAALRLVDEFLLAWLLLAVCWWCAWKLTWDCTLIDDNADASGEGLLQAVGFRDETTPPATPPAHGQSAELEVTDARADVEPPATDRPVHAPGKWVVYFSLAALPIFGIGQLFIPAHDTEARAYGFSLLAVYVASALGLLLTTSFLGLRRYLRQRNLKMPAAMSRTWLATGTAIVIALLCVALLLPQPQGEYSVNALVDKIDGKLREASRFAVVRGDRATGEGRRIGQQDPQERKGGDAAPQDRRAQAQQKPGDGQRNEQNGGDQKGESKDGGEGKKKADGQGQEKQQGQQGGGRKARGDQQQDDKNQTTNKRQAAAEKSKEAERQENRSSPPPPASSSSALNSLLQFLAPLFKWLVYAALAVVAFIMLNRHGSRIREFLGRLWAELLNLLGWRRQREQAASAEQGASLAIEVRPFAAYENPFFTGAAQRMSPAQLVRYTFEALEAWAGEQVVPRPPEQTPLEFAQELGRRVPALAKDVTSTAALYVRVAYSRNNPSRESVQVLERLWRRMGMGAGV